MMTDQDSAILDLALKHGQYHPNAYRFTLDAVNHAVRCAREIRHVSGTEVLEGARELAIARFGPVAKTVLEQWGIEKTEDFGAIVFQMVEQGLLGKTPEDKPGDFARGYDFEKAFVRDFDWLDRIGFRKRSELE